MSQTAATVGQNTLSRLRPVFPARGKFLLGSLLAALTLPVVALVHEIGHILGLVITGYHGPAVLGFVDGDPITGAPIRLPIAFYWAAGPLAALAAGGLVLLIGLKAKWGARHPVLVGTLWGFGLAAASMRLLYFPILLLPGHTGGSDESLLAGVMGVPTLWVAAPIFLLSLAITIGLYRLISLRGFKGGGVIYLLPLLYFIAVAFWEDFARHRLQAQLHWLLRLNL
jgi:hypothetical protein